MECCGMLSHVGLTGMIWNVGNGIAICRNHAGLYPISTCTPNKVSQGRVKEALMFETPTMLTNTKLPEVEVGSPHGLDLESAVPQSLPCWMEARSRMRELGVGLSAV